MDHDGHQAVAQEMSFDLEIKGWTEAFQSTQKRTRTALLLSTFASCVVFLMVFNLFESRELRNIESIRGSATSSEYIKAFSTHIADESYYQIPALGIQITCDDVGLFGPLALLVFSLYSVMAFKAFDCQTQCGTCFPKSGLIRALLETSRFENVFAASHLLKSLLFLPSAACVGVIFYAVYAHFKTLPKNDPLYHIAIQTRPTAQILDGIGLLCAVMVLTYNHRTLKFFASSQKKITKSLEPPELARSTAA
ncbi:MAG TPA: hypothetical protein VI636_04050 [Candidatus Angelobacter sp.]